MDQISTANQRILFVENDERLRVSLTSELSSLGHTVVALNERRAALARDDLDSFDLIISDLADDVSNSQPVAEKQRRRLFTPAASSNVSSEHVAAFKIGANSPGLRRADNILRPILKTIFSHKSRFIDDPHSDHRLHEKIDFELPSDLSLMSMVIDYLLDRVTKLGLIRLERSNLFVALDEAFVNAVKHGNKHDQTKLLRITAELSREEAIFTVEDEGSGFDVSEIPDPCDPANLFRTSGRGVMLMYNIMDKVEYNAQGNRVTMTKRSGENSLIKSPPKRVRRPNR